MMVQITQPFETIYPSNLKRFHSHSKVCKNEFMKKLLLLISITVVFELNAKACDCASSLNTFCKAVEAATDESIVARVVVEERNKNTGKLRILNVYKGFEAKIHIQVWGNDGFSCRDNIGNVGQTFIMILHRLQSDSRLSLGEKKGDYSTWSFCTVSHVLIEDGKIKGNLTDSTTRQVVDDSDPKRLPFCPNFKTDLEALQSIIITPNPTEDILYLKNLTNSTPIEIFDVLGREILQKTVLLNQSFINVADLAAGLYIVRFRKNRVAYAVKFIKV